MLSFILLGVQVMQRADDLLVCGLFTQTGRRRCFCCTLAIFGLQSFPLGSVMIAGTQVQDRIPPVLFMFFRAADLIGLRAEVHHRNIMS